MNQVAEQRQTDLFPALMASAAILVISLFLRGELAGRQYLLFIVGVGLGITLLHAAFGFSGGWRRFIRDRDSAGVRAQILLLGITSILFFPLVGNFFPGIQAGAALAPVGTAVIVGAFLFGIGMQLGGGCGSGTLYTAGQGQVDMLITLIFFVVGATLGTTHLHWWLSLPGYESISLIENLGWWQGLLTQLAVLALLYFLVRQMEAGRKGSVHAIDWRVGSIGFTERLVHGPWPLWWGVLGLAILSLATLLLAGYPWSITYAFGLWGAKIWGALGGEPASWSYWSSGYPNLSLNSSVLLDTTSVMDFGVILGALLAAALAGKYAPASRLGGKRLLTAVTGGLLLGYGARLGFGCNIGAMLGGIASGSLHGWLWMVAGFCGGIAGVRMRVWLGIDRPLR
ncbi:MAG: YeeE/YedE family protein [Gammaproteobacteria bacterium]|nr:YeeE/YedE family protein [Gammaproteobacteria bacterium]